MKSRAVSAALLGLAVIALVAVGLASRWALALTRATLEGPIEKRPDGYVGSATCRSCHQDHHRSWHVTFHRTMTQEATARSVQGAFDGRIVEAWGGRVRPVTENGRYFFEYLRPDGSVNHRYEVKRTVGSHRYQQYLTQLPETGGNYHRLHLLWHNGDRRWVHMNAAFLYSDDQHFGEQVTTWNPNCIFCHNTGPKPGMTNFAAVTAAMARGEGVSLLTHGRFESEVAELGIACEACHGPGEAHARLNRNPLRRYWLAHGDRPDPSIVNPARLDALASAQVCGQCHGQRLPPSAQAAEIWLTQGPTYRPGDDLFRHVRLVWPEEPGTPAKPDLYRARFWADRSPRLSAYELQGLLLSPCHQKAGLTCRDCHTAHGGDPKGMMRPEARTNAVCASCHQSIAEGLEAHTRHRADGPGSLCINCHMPEMVYGVMEIHRSHRIEIPDVAAARAASRPDPCTQCHLGATSAWAEAALSGWRDTPLPSALQDLDGEVPAFWLELFAGDPVQRAVAARTAGRPGRALDRQGARSVVGALLLAMDDDYPAVRRFAWHSARALAAGTAQLDLGEAFDRYDFTGPVSERESIRRAALETLRRAGVSGLPDAQQVTQWRAQAAARGVQINIGE